VDGPVDVIVTTTPFGTVDPAVLDLLEDSGHSWRVSEALRSGRTPERVLATVDQARVVIAGTEPYPAEVIERAERLEAICRVGIGLDNVDLLAAEARGVAVAFTPDGPSPAVAELTVGLIVDVLRGVSQADRTLRAGTWGRIAGRRIAEVTVGIVGAGRIGSRVARHLAGGFPGVRLLAHDLAPDATLDGLVEWVGLDRLLTESDVVSIHLPRTPATVGLFDAATLARLKPDAALINTARGGIVDETALYEALSRGTLRAAAIDVFEEEPYAGPLTGLEGVTLTCHMGSMTSDCRGRMEREAAEDALRFLRGEPLAQPVPPEEYAMARAARLGR
jgi:D-3-phosphoglycerate dehydrogenase / 2-oxoglutarate reductase